MCQSGHILEPWAHCAQPHLRKGRETFPQPKGCSFSGIERSPESLFGLLCREATWISFFEPALRVIPCAVGRPREPRIKTVQGLHDACRILAQRTDVRIVVFTGNGRMCREARVQRNGKGREAQPVWRAGGTTSSHDVGCRSFMSGRGWGCLGAKIRRI